MNYCYNYYYYILGKYLCLLKVIGIYRIDLDNEKFRKHLGGLLRAFQIQDKRFLELIVKNPDTI